MKEGKHNLINSAYIMAGIAVSCTIMEALIGSFPIEIFRFPQNVLTMILWIASIYMLYQSHRVSPITKFMLSTKATWITLVMMATIGVVLGLQREPASTSWIIIAALLFILSHLSFVILRGWRREGKIRWLFSLTHVGIWLALSAAFWGAPDREQLRIAIDQRASNEAYTMDGKLSILPYTIKLKDFCAEYAENGAPTHLEAKIDVDGEIATIRVNEPYNYTASEKIYLISFGATDGDNPYVIVEVVKEPWQWFIAMGIVMLIVGSVVLFVRGPRRTYKTNNAV